MPVSRESPVVSRSFAGESSEVAASSSSTTRDEIPRSEADSSPHVHQAGHWYSNAFLLEHVAFFAARAPRPPRTSQLVCGSSLCPRVRLEMCEGRHGRRALGGFTSPAVGQHAETLARSCNNSIPRSKHSIPPIPSWRRKAVGLRLCREDGGKRIYTTSLRTSATSQTTNTVEIPEGWSDLRITRLDRRPDTRQAQAQEY